MNGSIAINGFVKRQKADSPYSHFSGTWDELIALVQAGESTPGYRDGVVLVEVPADGFYAGVVEVQEDTELVASFEARRKGEEPALVVRARGSKVPAQYVEIVLYRHDVLAEDGDNSTSADWEVISINARPTEGPEPLTPMAMARNFLGLPGGTEASYTAEEFARAIHYWSKRAMVAE